MWYNYTRTPRCDTNYTQTPRCGTITPRCGTITPGLLSFIDPTGTGTGVDCGHGHWCHGVHFISFKVSDLEMSLAKLGDHFG